MHEIAELSFAEATRLRRLTEGFNAFGFRLFRHLGGHGDVFISPLSISMALGLLLPGARERCRQQLAGLLGIAEGASVPGESIARLMAHLSRAPGTPGPEQVLDVANALFMRRDIPLKSPYRLAVEKDFGAEVRPVDFADAPAAADLINAWIESHTRGMITDMLAPSDIDPLGVVVLVNAVYFWGAWRHPFDETLTHIGDFHALDSGRASTPVRMMRGTFDLEYLRDRGDGVQVVRIPYGTTAMLLVLPDEGRFRAVGEALDGDRVRAWWDGSRYREVDLQLPRFELRWRENLNDVLRALGLRDAFAPDAADFGGMTDAADVYISNVLHEARVKVNERGTEAAAATAVTMTLSLPMRRPKPIPFVVDRPFYFLIMDVQTRTVVFIGAVTTLPAAAGG